MAPRDHYCGECAYWVRPLLETQHVAECRRHAPTAWDSNGEAAYPKTYGDEWCGDFVAEDDV